MKKTKLGYLKVKDMFYLDGHKHKANSFNENKNINAVCCTNLETKKRVWLDVDTEVEVEDEKK